MVLKFGHFGKYTTNKTYLESFEMWCCRNMICWTDSVRDEVLQRGREERNILHTIKRRKGNWIGHVLSMNCILKQIGHVLSMNCILKHIIEGKIREG